MDYVEGFVTAVPTANKEKYITHCQLVAALFKKHGALSYVECWGEDVPDGEVTSFPMAVKCRADETVVFSWISWPSKSQAKQGMAAVMKEYDKEENPMPFDTKRIIYGGFEMVVNE